MDNQENKQNDDDKKSKDKDKQEESETKVNNNPPENINDGDNKNESFTAPYNKTSKNGPNNENNNEDNIDNSSDTSSTEKNDESSAENPKKPIFQQLQENVSEINNEDNDIDNSRDTSSTEKNDESSAENSKKLIFQQSPENVSETNNEDNIDNSSDTSLTEINDESSAENSKKPKFQQSPENVSETNNEDNNIDNSRDTSSTEKNDESSAENSKKPKFQQSPENVSETNNEDNVDNSSNEDNNIDNNRDTSSTEKNDESSAENPKKPKFQQSPEIVSETNNEDNNIDNSRDTSSTEKIDESSAENPKKPKFQQSPENVSETNNEDNNIDNSRDTSSAGENDQSYNNPGKSEKQKNKDKGKSTNEGSIATHETDEREDSEKEKSNLNEPTEATDPIQANLSKSQRKKLKKKQQAAQNNEESPPITQNQSQDQQSSSSTFSSFINTAKNLIRTDEEEPDDTHIKIKFHVHLPSNISGMGEPIIMGNIPELGEWKEFKVKLRQFKRSFQSYTTYWYSEPIKIPIERFQRAVKYKYAIYKKGGKKNKNTSSFHYEGISDKDDRVLEMYKNQFDIWMKNNRDQQQGISDYMFLETIYNSVNQNNFKEAILEYDKILKNNRELTKSVTNLEFINRRKQEKSVHKRLFLCFLLGQCSFNSNFIGKFELPRNFHPGSLLEVISKIQHDTFPSENLRVVSKGIGLLIHHDIDRRSFEWLRIFPVAQYIDPKYSFIDSISFNYDNYIEKFFENLDSIIPYINAISNENVYVKVVKPKFQQSPENVSETNNEDNNIDNSRDTSSAGENDQSYNNPGKSEKQKNKDKGKSTNEGSIATHETDEREDSEKEKSNLNEPTEATDPIQANLSKSQRKKLKKKQQAAQNNEESPPITQNQSQDQQSSSSTFSSFINTAKNLIRTDEEEPDDTHIKIKFHVHLPSNISGMGEPIIMGNIPELGEWKEFKVKLRQFKRSFQSYTTYWYSEPIKIPIERFQRAVKYKYAIYKKGGKKNKNTSSFHYEGISDKDDRVLEMYKNQFDIWMKNNRDQQQGISDYMFLETIYNSVNQNNFKEAILEYDKILKNNRELTKSVTNLEFINRRKQEKSVHKRLFLCFLLGQCSFNSNFIGKFELPRNFHPGSLLEVISKIQHDTFPSENLRVVSKGIGLLIHHDIDRRSFEWLRIFPVAQYIDPKYSFIDSISFNYDNYIEKFFENLDSIIPYINAISNENVYVKVVKVERLIPKHDPVELNKCFKELPENIRNIVTEPFRKKTIQLLKNGQFSSWERPRADAIFTLVNSPHLQWTKVDYLTVLETISDLIEYKLLDKFPILLKNWITGFKDTKDDKISQICVQWYKRLMDRMSTLSSSSASNEGTYVTTVFQHLSDVSIINEESIMNELIEITYNRIRHSSEVLIFRATTKVANMDPRAVLVFKRIIKEKINSTVQNHDEFLLKKMRVLCGCTNLNGLNIPNKLCEEILNHIMTRLKDNSSRIDFEEFSTQLHLSLFESANFWTIILRATGNVENFHSHPHVQEAKTAIIKLATMINDGSIDIRLLQDLNVRNDNFLHYYLNSAESSNEIIVEEKLAEHFVKKPVM
ncbi:unnamed protein product [Rhizophagus irregularis]|nr:unnamed protein product [Rhizophagus irregularis]